MLVADVSGGSEIMFSEQNACPECGVSIPELTPAMFSFNSPLGMCPACNGLGTRLEVDEGMIVQDPALSLMDGALRWYGELRKKRKSWTFRELANIAEHYGADLEAPWQELPEAFRQTLLYGSGEARIRFAYHAEWDQGTWTGESERPYEGIVATINRRYKQTKSEWSRQWYTSFMSKQPCPACRGQRLRPESAAVTVGGRTMTGVTGLNIGKALAWIEALLPTLDAEQLLIGEEVLKEIHERLMFLVNVGLHYLSLDRPAPTLSGGEGQRIRLASQIGCGLVGVLYVLDEPSIGLHSRDNRRLLDTLERLRDMGNTVVVVEHDEETIRTADWIVDLGPGAGDQRRRGGLHRHTARNPARPRLAHRRLPARRARGGLAQREAPPYERQVVNPGRRPAE